MEKALPQLERVKVCVKEMEKEWEECASIFSYRCSPSVCVNVQVGCGVII